MVVLGFFEVAGKLEPKKTGSIMPFVEALPAATIVLIRDKNNQIEIFLQKRNSKTSFGGLYVFPGGKVSRDDNLIGQDDLISELAPEEADSKLKLPANGIGYWIAAVRECFEEAGFLLAYNEQGEWVNFIDKDLNKRFRSYREKINGKQMTFHQMCRKEKLTLALGEIYPCDHWITPPGCFHRYDTRFFITRAPEGQEGHHDNYEAIDSVWLAPHAALDRCYKGTLPLISPTFHTIETLLPFTNVDDALFYMSGYESGRPKSF